MFLSLYWGGEGLGEDILWIEMPYQYMYVESVTFILSVGDSISTTNRKRRMFQICSYLSKVIEDSSQNTQYVCFKYTGIHRHG